jgi:hypothetical protein
MIETYADLARRVLDRPARLGRTRLVAVDGPSGAGKTVFAERLAAALGVALEPSAALEPAAGPAAALAPTLEPGAVSGAAAAPAAAPVVHTDELLDGWADQVSFWPRLEEWVLAPLRAGQPGRYRRYSWHRREFTPPWITVPAGTVVVLEGVTAARAVIRPELTCAIFVTAPSRLRLDRALARDGAAFRPHLDRWRRGERTHFAADGTRGRVDLVVDGAPDQIADPATHYLRLPASSTVDQ